MFNFLKSLLLLLMEKELKVGAMIKLAMPIYKICLYFAQPAYEGQIAFKILEKFQSG